MLRKQQVADRLLHRDKIGFYNILWALPFTSKDEDIDDINSSEFLGFNDKHFAYWGETKFGRKNMSNPDFVKKIKLHHVNTALDKIEEADEAIHNMINDPSTMTEERILKYMEKEVAKKYLGANKDMIKDNEKMQNL